MSDPPNLFARLENRQKEETELKNERAVLTEKYQRDNTTRAGLLSQLETAQGQERIRIKDTLDELNAELDRTLFAISDINGRITIVGGKIDELVIRLHNLGKEDQMAKIQEIFYQIRDALFGLDSGGVHNDWNAYPQFFKPSLHQFNSFSNSDPFPPKLKSMAAKKNE